MTGEWKKAEEWKRQDEGYCVLVKHWTGSNDENKWNVYAYIYPKHWYFEKFDLKDEDMFQSAARDLPLHCGPRRKI